MDGDGFYSQRANEGSKVREKHINQQKNFRSRFRFEKLKDNVGEKLKDNEGLEEPDNCCPQGARKASLRW